MKVFEHFKTLPKVEGLVPIYISPQSGQFSGENIRLGSRGDSYYEYLIKVWLQQQGDGHETLKCCRQCIIKEHPEYAKNKYNSNHVLRNGVTASELQLIQCLPGFIHF